MPHDPYGPHLSSSKPQSDPYAPTLTCPRCQVWALCSPRKLWG